jgi:hypothetical protein
MVIERMVDQDEDLAADAYYKANKDSIVDADLSNKVAKLVEASSLRGQSQRNAEKLFAESKGMSEALEEARKIESPKLQDETIKRVKERYAMKKLEEEQAREALTRDAWEKYASKGSLPPMSYLEKMSKTDAEGYQTYVKNKIEGKYVPSQIKVYNDLSTMASAQATRNKFLRTDLTDPYYLNTLDESDRKHFINMQKDLRSGKGEKDKELDGYRSDMQIVNDSLDKLRIKHSSDKAEILKRQVDERYYQHIKETGKKPNNLEMQKIVDDLTSQVITHKGFLWDTKQPKFEVGAKKIDEVPKEDKSKIEVVLNKLNRPITDADIIKYYNNQQLKKLQQK